MLLSSLIGYLEWGGGHHAFLLQAEYEVISRRSADSFLHPLVILPLTGQLLLLITLFQRQPRKVLTYTGLGCLSILMGLLFIIGLLGKNPYMVLSAIPFLVLAVLVIRANRKSDMIPGSLPPEH